MSTIKRPLMFNEYPEFNDYYAHNIVDADNPAVVVDTMIAADFDLFGKKISELQSGIIVRGNTISGYLYYLDDYSGWSAGASGNFLAIRVYSPGASTVTVELVNGQSGPVTLDADRVIVLQISDTSTQSIKVVSTNADSTSTTKTYTITGLTLEEAPEVEE